MLRTNRTIFALLAVGLSLAAGITSCSSSGSSSVLVAPTASNDTFTFIGNTVLSIAPGAGVLSNDSGLATTVTAFDATSTNGATVAVASDGSFTYTPVAGSRAADTFTYTVTNSSGSSVGTVTMNFGTMVWWIDNSGANGDGTEGTPYNSIANFNTGATDQTGDVIYVRSGSGAYDGTFTLLDDQDLIGEGVALIVGSTNVQSAGTAPTLAASSGNAIDLGANNELRGFDVGNTPAGFAIADGGSTVGTLAVTSVAITGTGGAISMANGSDSSASVTLTSVASASAPGSGIALTSYSGTFIVSGTTTITGAASASLALSNMASGTVTLAAVNISGYQDRAIDLNNVDATVNTGAITLGAHGGSTNLDSIVINDVNNVTLGDLVIADSDQSAIEITTHPVGQTLTFGDITLSAAADNFGLEILSVAGTINFGDVDFDGGAVSGNGAASLGGVAATAMLIFNSFTAQDDVTMPSAQGTINCGATTVNGSLTLDSASGATFTFNNLVVNSSGDGFRVTNGDGTALVNLTGTAANVTANGVALEIDDTTGDDGAGGGWMFGSIIGTGTSGIILTDLADDFTVTTATTITALTGTAITVTNAATANLVFGGTTTLGTSGANRVDRGIVISGIVFAPDFTFTNLTIDAITDGVTADGGILTFAGTAPTITTETEHVLSLTDCASGSGGSATWTFGNLAATGLATSVENMIEIFTSSANLVFNGTVTATTAAGLGGDVIHVDTFTGNITTVGLVSATAFTEANADLIFFQDVTGNITLGPATATNYTGNGARGIAISSHNAGGTVTFGGAVTVTGFSGDTTRGVEIGNSSVANVSVEAAIVINTMSGLNTIGFLTLGGTGTVESTVAGSFQIDTITGSGGVGLQQRNWTGTMTHLGAMSFTTGDSYAIRLEGLGSQTVTFSGDVAIDVTTSGAGISVHSCPNATISFGNLLMDLGATGLAIDLRGDSDGSNAGASFTIDATDGASGINYTGGDATAIFADQLATLDISGATSQEFIISEAGTGSTDGAEANITNGPHGIFARDCVAVTISDVEFSMIGDTGTDGEEHALYVRNTGTVGTSVTVTACTFGENVDGHGLFVENTVNTAAPIITVFGNTFGDVTSQNDNCFGFYTSLDGTAGDVSATLVVSSNTIQNQGPTSGLGGAMFLELLNDAGATTPVQATIGTGAAPNTISNVTGDGIRISAAGNSTLIGMIENNSVAFTPGNLGEQRAVRLDLDAGTLEALDIDLTFASTTVSGFDNGTLEPIQVNFTGATRTSDVKLEINNSLFSNCSAAVAGIGIFTENDCFDGGVATGVFNVILSTNDVISTNGIETGFTGTNDSVLSLLANDNTNIANWVMDRDSGAGLDQLQIGDTLGTTDSDASDPEITAILTAGGGNNNDSGAVFTISAPGQTAVIIDGSTITAPSTP